MACNYCFPTGTIFQINSEFWKKGTFGGENRISCLIGLKTHPTIIVPRSGLELATSRLHSFIVAKVSHALNHSATKANDRRTVGRHRVTAVLVPDEAAHLAVGRVVCLDVIESRRYLSPMKPLTWLSAESSVSSNWSVVSHIIVSVLCRAYYCTSLVILCMSALSFRLSEFMILASLFAFHYLYFLA